MRDAARMLMGRKDDVAASGVNALDLLKSQHEEVRTLFQEIEQEEDNDEKLDLVEELADNLAAHATIEEKIFYPAAFASRTEDLLREAVEEHLAMKRLVADLLEMTPDDEGFDAKVSVLKEQVEHHVEEEENDLFAAVRKEISTIELVRLGEQMQAMFEAEMEGEPREEIAKQTKTAAPLR